MTVRAKAKPSPRPRDIAAHDFDATAEIEALTPKPSLELPARLISVASAALDDVTAVGQERAIVNAICAVLRALATDEQHHWLHDTDLLVYAERVSMLAEAA